MFPLFKSICEIRKWLRSKSLLLVSGDRSTSTASLVQALNSAQNERGKNYH